MKFQVNKTYYIYGQAWKIKFIEQDYEGRYHFKVTEHDDKDYDWEEYSTRDGSEILDSRKDWTASL